MGAHVIVNLYDCDISKLEYVKEIKEILDSIVGEAKLTRLGEAYHQFKPTGATGVVLLSESHLSIHTWPEYNAAAVDIFCCSGLEDAEKAFSVLIEKFKPCRFRKKIVKR